MRVTPVPDLGERVVVVDIDGTPTDSIGVVIALNEQGYDGSPRGLIAFELARFGFVKKREIVPPRSFIAGSLDRRLTDYRGPIPTVRTPDGTKWFCAHGWLRLNEGDEAPS